MLPTLVFTLVIADILRERFGLPPALFGALIVYTLSNTLIPSLVLRLPPQGFETLQAPELDVVARGSISTGQESQNEERKA